MHIEFWLESKKARDIGGKIVLRWTSEKWEGVIWTGFIWLRIGITGWLL
jgi:hypothetical protein